MLSLPTSRDEHWKYANLRALARLSRDTAVQASAATLAALGSRLTPPLDGFNRLTLIDGRYLPSPNEGSSGSLAEAGVRLTRRTPIAAPTGDMDRRFAALHAEHAVETLEIDLAAGRRIDLELACIASGTGHPSVHLRVGTGTELRLIERHLDSETVTSWTNLHLKIELAAGARIGHVRLLDCHAQHHQVDTLELHLADEARFELLQLTQGGASSRTTALVELAGHDSALSWQAATLASDQQVHDTYVRVNHSGLRARTDQRFRGIAADRSRIAFNGHMQVAASSRGASTEQSLKCLLGSTEAEADLRPQLEIDTDEVRATHGATVGMLDADMRFYLLSRGISPEAAEALLRWAFVSDIISRVSIPALRADIERRLAGKLPGAAAAGTLT